MSRVQFATHDRQRQTPKDIVAMDARLLGQRLAALNRQRQEFRRRPPANPVLRRGREIELAAEVEAISQQIAIMRTVSDRLR